MIERILDSILATIKHIEDLTRSTFTIKFKIYTLLATLEEHVCESVRHYLILRRAEAWSGVVFH